MLGTINRKGLREILNIESHLKTLLVLALGKPNEEVVIETVGPEGNIRYWRDAEAVHHVPKRSLRDIIAAFHSS